MSALGCIVQLKRIAIEERPVGRLHWSAFSSQRECVWQLTQFCWPEMKVWDKYDKSSWLGEIKCQIKLRTKPKYEIFPFSTLLKSCIDNLVTLVAKSCGI